MTRAVRVPRGRAPRGCARLSTVLLVIVVLAGAVPRTLAMRGAFASAFRSAERTLQEKGLLPHPDDDASAPASAGPDSDASTTSEGGGVVEADVDADDPGTDDVPSLPPAERLFRAATRLLDDRPDSARAQRRAATFLREALELDPNHRAALTALGRAHQAGEGVDVDDALALDLFRRAASLGDPGAHEELGFAHSTGWAGVSEDSARAVLHQYFAAMGGDPRGQMAMGYRHLHGLGTPKSCATAALYYEAPASKLIDVVRDPTAGPTPNVEKTRLTPDTEGGDGGQARERDVVQYYQYSADMGNADAATAIGRIFAVGAKGLRRDRRRAYRYFTQAAAQGDADAMSQLGHLFANGLGVRANNATAIGLFKAAAEKGNANAQFGLGYMHLAGFGVERNEKKALNYFTKAAEQGSAEAQFHVGAMHAKGVGVRRDYTKAFYNFNLAAHQGHAVALYNLAMMQLAGAGLPASCKNAVVLLKGLAERGPWNRRLESAHGAYRARAYQKALVKYMKAAETGVEVAQSNAAYVLEGARDWRDDGRLNRDWLDDGDRERRAVHYHRLAADQGNVGSLLRIGDAYYYGVGVGEADRNKSAAVYLQASQRRSAQAMFNLGTMHEHGLGLPKDLHLAKRYYDMVLSTDPKAWVPVKLALWKLRAHRWIDENWTEGANLGGAWWARHLGSVAAHPDLALAGVCGVLLAVVVALRGLVSLFAAFDPSTRARG